jgi:formate hydrogenlyase transcriptional activator
MRGPDQVFREDVSVDGPPLAGGCQVPVRIQASRTHGDVPEALKGLPVALRPVLDFDYLSLFLDPARHDGANWYVLRDGDRSVLTPTREAPIEAALASWVFQRQEPVMISRVDRESRFGDVPRLLGQRGLHSACAVPLTTAHRRLGSMVVAAGRLEAYAEGEFRSLALAADKVAVAADNALSHAELDREQDRLRLLLELTNRLASNLELRDVLRGVMTNARRVMRSDSAVVALPDGDSGQLRAYAMDFPAGEDIPQEGEPISSSGTLAGHVFRTGTPWVGKIQDLCRAGLEVDGTWATLGFKTGCTLPLVSRGRVLGTLGLRRRQDCLYTADEVEFLGQVANQIAMAVENARAYSEIRALKNRCAQEQVYLRDEILNEQNFQDIIGTSVPLRRVLKQVETVAPTDSTVIIYGETGTGKELLARAIHNLSPRQPKAFVKLNCAAIPTGLLESELFGHEKGAFTGAIAQRIGRFELAHGGTVFLDEVGEIPLELQTKLLRVLQEREFERLGSGRTLRTDARLIAATNRDLTAAVDAHEFRADLFYRLNVFPIRVPPLRERPADIPLLVRHFVEHYARRMNRSIETIPSDTMEALVRYGWPGNIRELQNLIERAVILSSGPVLRVRLEELRDRPAPGRANGKPQTLAEVERAHILATLQETQWVLSGPRGAASRLGMNRSTLQFRMKKLGIVRRAVA